MRACNITTILVIRIFPLSIPYMLLSHIRSACTQSKPLLTLFWGYKRNNSLVTVFCMHQVPLVDFTILHYTQIVANLVFITPNHHSVASSRHYQLGEVGWLKKVSTTWQILIIRGELSICANELQHTSPIHESLGIRQTPSKIYPTHVNAPCMVTKRKKLNTPM